MLGEHGAQVRIGSLSVVIFLELHVPYLETDPDNRNVETGILRRLQIN